MAKLTRRSLLKQTSIGAATVGVVAAGIAAAPHMLATVSPAHAAGVEVSTTTSGLMMVYIRDAAKGEVGVLVGEREIVHHDPDLVSRLLSAAH